MAKQTIDLSTPGAIVTVAENTTKINENFTELYEDKADLNEDGTIPVGQLPESNLSNVQFQQLVPGGIIELNENWITSKIIEIGLQQGWGGGDPVNQLSTPVMSAGEATETTIQLAWSASPNATGYIVYRLVSGAWIQIGTTVVNSYLSTGLTAENTYQFSVIAINSSGAYSPSLRSNTVTKTTLPNSGLITPTKPIITTSGRSLSATHNEYPNLLELSIDNQAWANYAANTIINFGDDAVLADYYRFRVKAVPDTLNSGLIAGNPYIAPATPSLNLVPVTDYRTLENINLVSNNQTLTPGSNLFGKSVSQQKILSGTPFVFQLDSSITTNSGWLSISVGTEAPNNYYFNVASIFWKRNTDTSGRFLGSIGPNEVNNYSDQTFTQTPQGRLRGDGVLIYFEQSFDGGATWEQIVNGSGASTAAQPNEDCYLKTYFDQSSTPYTVNNIQAYNMVD